jgi:hypothetical protein
VRFSLMRTVDFSIGFSDQPNVAFGSTIPPRGVILAPVSVSFNTSERQIFPLLNYVMCRASPFWRIEMASRCQRRGILRLVATFVKCIIPEIFAEFFGPHSTRFSG